MADVTLRDTVKRFGDIEVVHGVSLDIAHREFVVFLGPSGCGKSTLLRMIAGLDSITAGEIRIGGVRVNEVPAGDRGVAMVFQNYALYPHMTVYENMAFGLRNIGTPKAEIAARVNRAASVLRIQELLQRRPRDMSGGQRQRVAIGRAIVRDPEVFLFDEPLSNLDAALRVQMRIELARLHHKIDATMIYVTHDQVEAMTMADRIVVLNAGRVEQTGSPLEVYRRPRNLFVAGFIGAPKMNLLPAEPVAVEAGQTQVRLRGGPIVAIPALPETGAPGGAVTVGIRPEHLRIARGGTPLLNGRVDVVEHLGNVNLVYVVLDGGEQVIAEEPGDSEVRIDDRVGLTFAPGACHLFGADGLAFAPTETAAAAARRA